MYLGGNPCGIKGEAFQVNAILQFGCGPGRTSTGTLGVGQLERSHLIDLLAFGQAAALHGAPIAELGGYCPGWARSSAGTVCQLERRCLILVVA